MWHTKHVGRRDEFTRIPKRDRWGNSLNIDEKCKEEHDGGNDAISPPERVDHARDLR